MMPKAGVVGRVAAGLVVALVAASWARAGPQWVITSEVRITAPMDYVGDVVVATGGRLEIDGVPDPGFRLTGNLLVVGTGEALLTNSVIRILSSYNGEFITAAVEHGSLTISGCDYRVPSGSQHAIVATDDGTVVVEDSDFANAQLAAAENGTLDAERLDGNFEVILQEAGDLTLRDIPRDPGGGELWVWPDFPAGSRAVYSPPMPGFVSSWTFPPAGATGIGQRCLMERCQVRLWPLLVQPGSDLTLRDISPDNWVVVGLHLPNDTTLAGLANETTYVSHDLGLADRTITLEDASIDTWNLYPEAAARVTVRDCVIGELLAMAGSRVTLERTTIDGSGGYFGVRDEATVDADACTFTCDVQVSGNGTALLHRSRLLPYPFDTTGTYTRFGAYDEGRLLIDSSTTASQAVAGGSGLIGIGGLSDPPSRAPGPGESVELHGAAALFSLDSTLLPVRWRVEAEAQGSSAPELLGSGEGNVTAGLLGTWSSSDPDRAWVLRVILVDAKGREMDGYWPVDGAPRVRRRLGGTASASKR
jgi:hypothetical protein